MKNKMICILISILIISIIPSIGTSHAINKERIIQKQPTKIFTDNILDDYPVMVKTLIDTDIKYASPKPTPIETPSEFSWTNYNGKDWTTPAKHQGNCGSCWAFAALGVFESIIKIRENNENLNPDLSEQYLLSCIEGAGSCYGGSANRAAKLLMEESPQGNNHNGVPFESCFEYQADHSIPCSVKCEKWEEQLVPLLDYQFWYSETNNDRDKIKTAIIEKGPVVTHIKANDYFKIWGSLTHNENSYYPNFKNTMGINHVVMIVGWKDNPLISKGGYWICKNSWGTEWGYNGFFNIEYGALNIDNYLIVEIDYDPDSFSWLPTPDTGGPYGSQTNEEIIFDASKSIGYEGDIVEYLWDFGNDQTKTGKIVTHSYQTVGNYQVTLTVTDSKSNIASITTDVWIQDTNQPANKPIITGSESGTVGGQYKYTISSTDPEGNDVYFYIDWDDGNIEEWIGPFESGEEIEVVHSWNAMKQFNIKAKAKDVFDSESDWSSLAIKMSKNKAIRLFQPLFFLLNFIKNLKPFLQNYIFENIYILN